MKLNFWPFKKTKKVVDLACCVMSAEDATTVSENFRYNAILIEEVNRVRVHSLKELQQALKTAGNAKQVLLRIRSGERSQYVVLQTK